MLNEENEIDDLSQKIIKSLESQSTDGISSYISILLENDNKSITFDDYLDQIKKTLKIRTCQTSWNSDQLIIKCADCQKNNTSCVCIKCFLKGNHQGHKILIFHGSQGCCDCGDPMSWSDSGFCTEHSSPESNPELTQLDRNTRIKLISISRSAFYYCQKYALTNKTYFNHLIDFLTLIASIGDATRRCVSLAFCNSFDVIDLYRNCKDFKSLEYDKLHNFFSLVSSDDVFRTYFTMTILSDLPKIFRICQQLSRTYEDMTEQPLFSMANLCDITFFASTQSFVTKLISESKIDWFKILNELFHLILKSDSEQMTRPFLKNSFFSSSSSKVIMILKSAISALGNKNSKVIEIIECFSEILFDTEFTYQITRIFGDEINDPTQTQLAVFDIQFTNRRLLFNITKNEIFTKKPLFLLKKFFDSPRFKSIDKSINNVPIYFQSVLSKNIEFSQFFLLHILALNSLNLKEQKTLIDYISEVTDDIETFIKRWAILPLRYIAAVALEYYNFFRRNSRATRITLNSFKYRKNIKYAFSPTFSLIQKLLKTTKDIDTFYLMVISTFDLTVIESKDNYDEDEKRIILFNIFHFISCLIFDTFCSENNFNMMLRFKVISELMTKNMSLEDVNSLWYSDIVNDDQFLNDLRKFTSKEATKNGIKLHLTDSSDWHPILPYLELSEIIQLIQNFISKNPNSLINFPKIQNGFEYLLFSPTLWALTYCILDHESCKDYQIIHQLIFNVLIEISKNSETFYKDKNFNQTVNSNSILIVDKFDRFVEEIKNLTFDQFIKMKVNFNNNHDDDEIKGKSIIDLLSDFENIGLTVLKRMNISDFNLNSSESNLLEKEQLKKKNKEKAHQIKMQMMSNFNQKQKSFQSSDLLFEEGTEKVEKIECGICHIENDSDVFVYPALIYKSSLSSYFKWRFRNTKLNTKNSDLIDDEIPSSFKSFNTVHICLHPIHSHCIKDNKYSCPADRCKRNSSLPIIDSIFDFNSISNQKLIFEINKFVERAYMNDIKFAVFSLASEIEILEMRYRSNPNCLDNQTIAAKLRNIYLCIWHSLHEKAEEILIEEEYQRRRRIISKKIESDTWNQYNNSMNLPDLNKDISIESNVENICKRLHIPPNKRQNQNHEKENEIHLSPLMKYILLSMKIDEDNSGSNRGCLNMKEFIDGKFLPSTIQQNDSKLNHSEDDLLFKDADLIDELSNDYQKLLFLRCSVIFDHFSRKQKIQSNSNPNKEFIDWDEILSSSFLNHHYHIQNDDDDENNENEDANEMQMFSFVNVPDDFLNFILPPFSLPIDNYDDGEIAICLLTGRVVSLYSSNNSNEHEYIKDFINDAFDGSFSIFLILNGKNISEVLISNNEMSQNLSLKSFYVNKLNDVDIGINNGFLLFANQTKREEIIDNFLSGSWTSML